MDARKLATFLWDALHPNHIPNMSPERTEEQAQRLLDKLAVAGWVVVQEKFAIDEEDLELVGMLRDEF